MDYIAIGRKIKMYRKRLNLTQSQLAEKLDVSSKYISSIERGIAKTSLNKLENISKILKVDIVKLISDCDISSPNYAMSEISSLIETWSADKKDFLIALIEVINKYHFK